MKRDINTLANQIFDVVVIGGGIYGVCVAHDAALRGLSVAIIEQQDFGSGTSANSLKTIHGGLRYLQDGNLKLMRTLINERKAWLRIAPHLIHPMLCLMPTDRSLTRNRWVIRAALAINDFVSFDRNRALPQAQHLPNGTTISRAECLARLPGLAPEGITGGAIWHDAQMYNSERLLISVLRSAVTNGAVAANYAEVTGFLQNERGLHGVMVEDQLTGHQFPLQGRVVVNCSGSWTDDLLAKVKGASSTPKFHLSTAVNLVTRQLWPDQAVGFQSRYINANGRERTRTLFIAPWLHYSLVGTFHSPAIGPRQEHTVTEAGIDAYLAEINRALPGAHLSRDDVFHIHHGFLPMAPSKADNPVVKLVRQGQVFDHAATDGVPGLITVVGVKYTTARNVAQQAVDLVIHKLNRFPIPCRTAETPIFGGDIDRLAALDQQFSGPLQSQFSMETRRQMVNNYGSEYCRILNYGQEDSSWLEPVGEQEIVLKAEVIHAVREEMAYTLADVVQRRTELGSAGLPQPATLQNCATLMGKVLGWDEAKTAQELKATTETFWPVGHTQPNMEAK